MHTTVSSTVDVVPRYFYYFLLSYSIPDDDHAQSSEIDYFLCNSIKTVQMCRVRNLRITLHPPPKKHPRLLNFERTTLLKGPMTPNIVLLRSH